MVKLINPKHISPYVVYSFNYEGTNVPIILDENIYKSIQNMDKNWFLNKKGYVVTKKRIINNETGKEEVFEIGLHEVVMYLNDKKSSMPIVHINKLGIDNRIENLIFSDDKEIKKNYKKKSRTIELPKSLKISKDEIPSYVWYARPDDTHGDRFTVGIDGILWKSTCSKKLSTRYKLEETKKYIRYLKQTNPNIFFKYSMNGDLNENGIKLLNSFFKISKLAGFKLNKIYNNNSDKYLIENTKHLSDEEIKLLENKIF